MGFWPEGGRHQNFRHDLEMGVCCAEMAFISPLTLSIKLQYNANPKNDVILDDGLTPRHKMGRMHISSRAASIRLALCPSCPSSIGRTRLPPRAKAGPIMGPFSLHAAAAAAIPASALPFLPSFLPSYGAKLPRSFVLLHFFISRPSSLPSAPSFLLTPALPWLSSPNQRL